MSGDVQPRKRKDKKRKKDELGVEEPRGTAAVFGEGDVFMHSQHEHGTGGHWCAKIIFFSLLAVLVTLIGLIILENRGLTDLEANSVESRYSGVLEGWLEDAPDDSHHDEHTLELKHHDDVGGHDDDDEHSQEIDQDDEDDHGDEHEEADDHDDEVDQDDGQSDEDDQDDEDDANNDGEDDDNSQEQDIEEADEDEVDEPAYRRYARSVEYQQGEDDDDDEDEDNDDDLHKVDENDSSEDDDENDQDDDNDESLEQEDDNQSVEENDDDNEQSVEDGDDEKEQTIAGSDENGDDDDDDDDDEDNENDNGNDDESKEDGDNSNEEENDTREDEDEEEHDDDETDSGVEVEKLEKEISDEDVLSTEEPEQPDSKEDEKSQEDSQEATPDDVDDEEEYLELDDIDEPPPVVEHIKVPAGKPLAEFEEDTTSEKPQDTLAEEEEYERQQEELRREKAEASHVWLKLVVGGALLAATHAVVRRATASRDVPDDHASREETPAIDRRMTLIPEEAAAPATPTEVLQEPVIEEEIAEQVSSVIQSAPVEQESEEDEDDVEEIEIETKEATAEPVQDTVDQELYSDEEEDDEDEEEEIILEKEEAPKQSAPVTQEVVQPEPEEEVPDDVEIIDDEPLEEELEEEEEDDISDVDDAELLSRLEAKYGRLPEPERPGQKHKDGGNSIEDDWPGEPSEAYWRQQLDQAEQELRQGDWSAASRRVSAAELGGSARGKWVAARALDASAEARRDNALLSRAITAYLDLLKMNERLPDSILRQITDKALDRIRFRGSYMSAEPVYRLLIRRFPDVPDYRNNLTITFLMANRADLAEESIKETLKRWPDDRVALAHYGFVLKTQHNRLEEAIDAFQKALKDDVGPATEPRFYYHLGDSLLLLGRYADAHEVHKRGASLGHFLSPAQRSLYNVDRLKSQPWWTIEQTPYIKLARALEKSWKDILKEGEAARALYEKEKEGLKERGDWSQLDLFVRGQEVPNRCKRAPVTCSIVRSEPAAIGCRRGQVKFSSMEAGTHVRPHVGPTNCRLRMHLGLSNTKDTYIRVDQEIRQWQAGKVFMFDDSFEHEVWHNGTGARLVLIVDVWHPALSPAERRALPAI